MIKWNHVTRLDERESCGTLVATGHHILSLSSLFGTCFRHCLPAIIRKIAAAAGAGSWRHLLGGVSAAN